MVINFIYNSCILLLKIIYFQLLTKLFGNTFVEFDLQKQWYTVHNVFFALEKSLKKSLSSNNLIFPVDHSEKLKKLIFEKAYTRINTVILNVYSIPNTYTYHT